MPKKKTATTRAPPRGPTSRSRKNSPKNVRVVASSDISADKSRILRKSKRKLQDTNKDDSFKERAVSGRTFSNWKPITKTSQALLIQTIDSAIVSVLSQTSSVAYSDIQDVLNSLKRRILEKSRNLKAPTTKRPKFNTLEAECQKLERDALEASKQEEQLSEMVDEVARVVQEKKQLLEEMEKDAGSADTASRKGEMGELHYLLQEKSDNKLGVPALPKRKTPHRNAAMSNSRQIPEINKLLATFDGNEGLSSIRDYVTKLSDFVTSLPDEVRK